MRRILEYDLYQYSDREILLMEEFKPQGRPEWPTNWKEMDLWKELEAMGFTDVTTPIQAKNGNIMIVNREIPYMYPAGVVLQSSGYIRDKAARSGFIKQYKTAFTLDDLFNYIKDRWSKEAKRMAPEEVGTLTREDILLINKSTKAPWKWNPNTNSVDVNGTITIPASYSDELGGFKFGKVKGEFSIGLQNVIDSIENFAPSSVGKISIWGSDGGIKTTKGFPTGIKGSISIGGKSLESLEDLDLSFGAEYLMTEFFDIRPFNIETCLKVLELGSVKTYYSGGEYKILSNHDPIPGYDDKARALVTTILSNEILDSYFKKNPLKINLLDAYPDTKEGVLKRTGMRDLSRVAKGLEGGWFK
jgi:hypothetical protein